MQVWERIRELGGFYIHDAYGAPFTHEERFAFTKPREALFISIGELEKEYGRIVAVLDECESMRNHCVLEIWTEKYVLMIEEYDGKEYIIALPRNPPEKAEKVVQ